MLGCTARRLRQSNRPQSQVYWGVSSQVGWYSLDRTTSVGLTPGYGTQVDNALKNAQRRSVDSILRSTEIWHPQLTGPCHGPSYLRKQHIIVEHWVRYKVMKTGLFWAYLWPHDWWAETNPVEVKWPAGSTHPLSLLFWVGKDVTYEHIGICVGKRCNKCEESYSIPNKICLHTDHHFNLVKVEVSHRVTPVN